MLIWVLKIVIISVIESMRNNPSIITTIKVHCHPSSTTSKDNNNSNLLDANRQVVLPPPPYDEYIIEGYKDIMLEEAEKLYNVLVDQVLCEVVNEMLPNNLQKLCHLRYLHYH